MSVANQLRENRKKQKDLAERHQEIGKKFNTYAVSLRKQCDEKLKREAYAPFLAIERAHAKAQKVQAEVISQLRVLEAAHADLLRALDAEDPGEVSVEPTSAAPESPPEPEFDPAEDAAEDFEP